MAKQGEIEYLAKIGPENIGHAVRKPFSEPQCPTHLMQLGAIMSLLPPPPARLLDAGCGTGWTSVFYARRGYDVVGADIAPDMISHANHLRDEEGLDNLRFVVADYEEMDFDGAFDAAVFYDSLHHAVDEDLAVSRVCRALRPGGVCVTSEPGKGHADSPGSIEAIRKFNVTEKDMPPERIIAAGRRAGFREFRVYPNAQQLQEATYRYTGHRLRRLAAKRDWVRRLGSLVGLVRTQLFRIHDAGLVVMVK